MSRINDIVRDRTTGEYILITNLIQPVGSSAEFPCEGLVFRTYPDGSLRTWTMQDIRMRTYDPVSESDVKRVYDWYMSRLEEMGRDHRAGLRSYYAVVLATPGKLLLGGAKRIESSRFASRADVNDYIHALSQQSGFGSATVQGSRKSPEIRSID